MKKTRKKVGTCTMSVDKTGDITLTFYAIAWSGNAGELNLSVSGGGSIDGKAKLVLQPNTGANNNSPYTITFGDHDFYTVKLKGLTADSKLTIATASGKTRAILVGINAK